MPHVVSIETGKLALVPSPRPLRGPFREFCLTCEPPHGLLAVWVGWSVPEEHGQARPVVKTIEVRWDGRKPEALSLVGSIRQTARHLIIGDLTLVHTRIGRSLLADTEYARAMTAVRRFPHHVGAYRLDTGDTAFVAKVGEKEARFEVFTQPAVVRLTLVEAW